MEETRLRADERVSEKVIANASADIDYKVVRAGVAGAEEYAIAGGLVSVDASALPSDAGEQIRTNYWLGPRR